MGKKAEIKTGRVIAARREQLETSSQRIAAQKKGKKKKTFRLVFVSVCFVGLVIALVVLSLQFSWASIENETVVEEAQPVYRQPTLEIVDEDAAVTGGKISNRMNEYIGQIELDFGDLGYTPTRAVLPSGTVREIDFYFAEFGGYIKTTLDRDTAVTAEDMDRMVRYLNGREFEYIDVRVEGKGYWK